MGSVVLADANECPSTGQLAEAEVLAAARHSQRAAAAFAAPHPYSAVSKIVGVPLPFHPLWICLHAAVKADCSHCDWTVYDVLKCTVHSILSYGYSFFADVVSMNDDGWLI